jgi:NAD(P)H-flavin reductase
MRHAPLAVVLATLTATSILSAAPANALEQAPREQRRFLGKAKAWLLRRGKPVVNVEKRSAALQYQEAQVVATRREGPSSRGLGKQIVDLIKRPERTQTVTLELDKPIDWLPGQSISIEHSSPRYGTRASLYSIAGGDPSGKRLDVTIKEAGHYKTSVDIVAMKRGGRVQVGGKGDGAIGKVVDQQPGPHDRLVLIAAGSGSAGIRPFWQRYGDKVHSVLMSFKNSDEILYRDELKQLPASTRTVVALTRDGKRPSDLPSSIDVVHKRLGKEELAPVVEAAQKQALGKTIYVIVGGKGFADKGIKSTLVGLGVAAGDIKVHAWGE